MTRYAVLIALAASVCPAETSPRPDILFLGEVHDNPAHHAVQAEEVAALQPAAVVWEMMTEEMAERVAPELLDDPAALGAALGWDESGWPEFSVYHPIFQAAGDARHYGAALPREEARALMGKGMAEVFGDEAARFGLDRDLPEPQQAAREALQMAAHCDALPQEMLPVMVSIQRLRDARIARAALLALDETGGPVAVITGNGHARKDWGAPALVAAAAPEVRVTSIGQAETGRGAPEGGFDDLRSAPPVDRGDPCAAFAK